MNVVITVLFNVYVCISVMCVGVCVGGCCG